MDVRRSCQPGWSGVLASASLKTLRASSVAHDISRIRSRINLLFGVTTGVVAALLLLVTPAVCDLAPRAARSERLNVAIFGPLLLVAMLVALHRYLRPISDLGHALNIGSTPTAELARQARRIAFNALVIARNPSDDIRAGAGRRSAPFGPWYD